MSGASVESTLHDLSRIGSLAGRDDAKTKMTATAVSETPQADSFCRPAARKSVTGRETSSAVRARSALRAGKATDVCVDIPAEFRLLSGPAETDVTAKYASR